MKSQWPKKSLLFFLSILLLTSLLPAQMRQGTPDPLSEEHLLAVMHSISSHTLLDYVKDLSSEKFDGRLTGTAGYNRSAAWMADLFKRWNIKPGGDQGSYLQSFPDPYTLVLPGAELGMRIPVANHEFITKNYLYEEEFYPGSTSDSGTLTAEIVYVGYGITAPELKYDEYQGTDVKGKIVMMEPEVPISPDKDPAEFKRWRPYSFHDYKMKNAAAHGAAGVIYNYLIVNPNCVFIKGLLLSYIGKSVVDDVFSGTGKKHDALVEQIRMARTPLSFATEKIMTMKNVTEHHPDGVGTNVIGYLEGKDPVLKNEVIIIGAHLDHLGRNPELMPGANDNASGVAVVLGVAEALAKSSIPMRQSVVFLLFGAEEQGVKGSEYYLAHPFVPNDRVKGFVNLESVGRGEQIGAGGGKNYPQMWEYFEKSNRKYIHRVVTPGFTANLARPRQDAAHFMWAGIPTISFGTHGAPRLPFASYHTTHDTPDTLTPEIMEDLSRLVFLATVEMANH
jgi:hypothetical protein